MVATDLPSGGGTGGCYRFGDVEVDPTAHTLTRGGRPQAVEPKAFAVLLALLRRPNELIPRDELLDAVWGHRHVTPGVLTRAIAQLRRALDDDSEQPRYIQTQHALGYRFVGELQGDGVQRAGEGHEGSARRRDATRAERPATESDTMETRVAAARPAAIGRSRLTWLAAAVSALGIAAVVLLSDRPPPPPPLDASIAVLPFATLSDDRSDQYFSEGLAIELHDALAGVPGLKVAAWIPQGALPRERDAKALGERLGVATVLDASVRREGKRLRINARLSDTGSGLTLWSRRYDRELADVFELQSELAGHVAGALTEVLPATRQALTKRLTPTRNVAAFDAYLHGLQQLLRDRQTSAVGHFEQALARDGRFARAQAGICRSEVERFDTRRDADAYARAQRACRRAEAMDPQLSIVKIALAELHHEIGDTGRAVAYYAQAERDPATRPAAYAGLAMVYADQGKRQDSLRYFSRAQALRPGDASIHSISGYYSYLAGDITAAIASYRRAIALKPADASLWNMLGMMYMNVGDNRSSEDALRKSIAIAPNYAALSNLGELAYQAGRYSEAAALHRRAIALEPNDFLPWGNLADALRADRAGASRSQAAYREAALRAQRYVEINAQDAKALAALGWYRANLGQASAARELVLRSEALGTEAMEVALFNAQTFVALGDPQAARRRVAAARAAGMPPIRIATNAVLRDAALVPGPS